MKRYVLDSYALIAYAEGEKGVDQVAEMLKDSLSGKAEIFLCVINWGEMYYIALREGGKKRAELYKNTFARYPITIVEANKELTLQAAQYKAFHKMSYADAFAVALAKNRKAVLVTGDKEFRTVEGDIKISWIN
ncbi:MAG: type II toxin-antitoxin system VapC family toxin [Bacteroidetes bacterium]|nr:type II toxin-antitoxin system VapC family toxin [Bacteroidota bacterium]MBU1678645.1 type II toxin-antitoxin system VapC family toxin [Bacteroidota bacterium]MBU2507056.1 type II toxin-antitoxin system VapC family toxin [Bacteroidota bacterium]